MALSANKLFCIPAFVDASLAHILLIDTPPMDIAMSVVNADASGTGYRADAIRFLLLNDRKNWVVLLT